MALQFRSLSRGSLAFASLLTAGYACGGSGGPHPIPRATGGATGGRYEGSTGGQVMGGEFATGGSASCPSGSPCECEPGRYGCTNDESNCSCKNECEPYDPTSDDLTEFEPCGGAPFGAWRLTGIDTSGLTLKITNTDLPDRPVTECAAEIAVQWDETRPKLLILEDGGTGSVNIPSITSNIRLHDSCGFSCENLGGCAYSADCQLCECTKQGTGQSVRDRSWTRTAETLSFGSGSTDIAGDYCVEGNTLEWKQEVGTFSFEKVTLLGAPKQCSARDAEKCEGAGCAVGVCKGETKCGQASAEVACGVLEGCTWDATGCGGQSEQVCALADWGVVDGCEIVTGPVRCEGVAPNCDEVPLSDCGDTFGCSFGRCSGLPTNGCANFYAPGCEEKVVGCSDPSYGDYCEGDPRCDAQHDSYACVYLGCNWEGSACVGNPEPCGGQTVAACQALPYCTVVAE